MTAHTDTFKTIQTPKEDIPLTYNSTPDTYDECPIHINDTINDLDILFIYFDVIGDPETYTDYESNT